MKKIYRHIFFDLDHTLWDFALNSKETLSEAYTQFGLDKLIGNLDKFLSTYWLINDAFWEAYRKGEVDRTHLRNGRFEQTLQQFGIDNVGLAAQISEFYIYHSPRKINLIQDSFEVLDYLKSKAYQLHIITNGFDEVQYIKLEHSKLAPYFKHIITSEAAGAKKPHASIFEFAIDLAGAHKAESLMIGDNLEADIIGAKNVGIDQVYFNPDCISHNENITHEITRLSQLKEWL